MSGQAGRGTHDVTLVKTQDQVAHSPNERLREVRLFQIARCVVMRLACGDVLVGHDRMRTHTVAQANGVEDQRDNEKHGKDSQRHHENLEAGQCRERLLLKKSQDALQECLTGLVDGVWKLIARLGKLALEPLLSLWGIRSDGHVQVDDSHQWPASQARAA